MLGARGRTPMELLLGAGGLRDAYPAPFAHGSTWYLRESTCDANWNLNFWFSSAPAQNASVRYVATAEDGNSRAVRLLLDPFRQRLQEQVREETCRLPRALKENKCSSSSIPRSSILSLHSSIFSLHSSVLTCNTPHSTPQ